MDLERDAGGLELISKAGAVLDMLEQHGEASAADLAAAIGEPLSSVYRLLQSLTATGWVDRGSSRGAYRLGLSLMTIGGLVEDHLDIREASLPSLRELVDATGVTSFLCVRRGPRAVCLERIEGYAVQSLAMLLGGSLPLYAGAAPRALLAFLPVAEQTRDLVRHQPATARRPPATRRQGHPCRHRPHQGGRLLGVRCRCHARHRCAGSAGLQPSRRGPRRALAERAARPGAEPCEC